MKRLSILWMHDKVTEMGGEQALRQGQSAKSHSKLSGNRPEIGQASEIRDPDEFRTDSGHADMPTCRHARRDEIDADAARCQKR
jgi:hypothetical protein